MTYLMASSAHESCRTLTVDDPSGVAAARRAAADLLAPAGWSETDVGRVSLLVTEAATNVLKHAGQGEIILRAPAVGRAAFEILAIDRGPGLAPERLLSDGYSSTGTLGAGLGTMRRQADAFDMYSQPGAGTAIRLEVRPAGAAMAPEGRLTLGVVAAPIPGETVSGDGWAVSEGPEGISIVVVDGLGHGLLAHDAANVAVAQVRRPDESPAALLERIHQTLRATRGAAVAVAGVAAGHASLRYAGIGNIAGTLVQNDRPRNLLSHNGIVGHNARRFMETSQPSQPGELVILASDGLGTRWKLSDYPGLTQHHPATIAAVLYRDHSRRRDDVVVLVARLAWDVSVS